jgi:mRNA interferase MazF
MRRGDVVIVDFPYVTGLGSKLRPALVVQNDTDNQRLGNSIVVMISGNLRHANQPTHLLVDPATAEGASSGLHGPSVVKCINVHTIPQQNVLRTVGHFSTNLMRQINDCLKAVLDLP